MAANESERVTNLEISMMHLSRDQQQMHEVLLALQSEVRLLNLALERLQQRLEQSQQPPEDRDPLMERPPHY